MHCLIKEAKILTNYLLELFLPHVIAFTVAAVDVTKDKANKQFFTVKFGDFSKSLLQLGAMFLFLKNENKINSIEKGYKMLLKIIIYKLYHSRQRQTCQHSRFGQESPALKENSDLPPAFCFISQSPAFHKKTTIFFEKIVFHFNTMKLSDLPGHKNRLHIIKLHVDLNACGEY